MDEFKEGLGLIRDCFVIIMILLIGYFSIVQKSAWEIERANLKEQIKILQYPEALEQFKAQEEVHLRKIEHLKEEMKLLQSAQCERIINDALEIADFYKRYKKKNDKIIYETYLAYLDNINEASKSVMDKTLTESKEKHAKDTKPKL
jgi:hypothetical protein